MISAAVNLYKKAYTGLTRQVWLLSVVMLINRTGTMVLAFMTLYCSSLGFTLQQGGFVVAIYGIGSVTGALMGGRLSDKFGFYYIQFSALLFGGVLFIILGQMNSYISICTCTFFLSLVNESFRPANSIAIAHYSMPENRTQSFSLVRLAINIGFSAGIAIGGFLASINYKLLFWADGITSIIAAFVLLAILPKVSLKQQQLVDVSKEIPAANSSPYKDRKFLYFIFLQVMFAMCFFQLFTTVPVFFKQHLHLNEFYIGVVMALNGIMIAIFEMIIVFKLEGRKPYLFLMRNGAILMGTAFLLFKLPLQHGLLIALLAIFIFTIAEMVSMPFMNSYYISRSSQQSRGRYAGLYTMAWSLAQVIGSTAGPAIAAGLGFSNLWLMVFITCLFTASGYYLLQKKESI